MLAIIFNEKGEIMNVITMPSEELARHVEAKIVGAYKSLSDLKPYIQELWKRFEQLKDGETIHGCTTKKEYCERVLDKSARAVQYMLYGRKPIAKRSEQCSLIGSGKLKSPTGHVYAAAIEARDKRYVDNPDQQHKINLFNDTCTSKGIDALVSACKDKYAIEIHNLTFNLLNDIVGLLEQAN